jgi:DNA (cytosine-5)-methyltransferase 1
VTLYVRGQLPLFDTRPVLVDGCCCAGGATKGYQQAGFYVVGVDIEPQPNYCGDEFVQASVVNLNEDRTAIVGGFITDCVRRGNRLPDGRPIAAYHVSPPCQPFSPMSACRPGLAATYEDLLQPLREVLTDSGLPWVMENVMAAPLRADLILCGQMFGLELYRHRKFESNVPLRQPFLQQPDPRQKCGWPHPIPASRAGHWKAGTIMSVAGHVSPMAVAREAMGGIDWMNRAELAESIPPTYSELIGEQLLEHVTASAAA